MSPALNLSYPPRGVDAWWTFDAGRQKRSMAMSVELILIPLALAAVSAWKASRTETDDSGRIVCQVETRMRDQTLLAAALSDTGAIVQQSTERITADWQGVRAEFTRGEQGIWSAHLTGEVDEGRAVEIVTSVDVAYGRQVQAAVLAKLRERAPAAGMTVESETTAEDASVTLVLTVGAAA